MWYDRSRVVNCSAACRDAWEGTAGTLMLAMRTGHGDRGLPGVLVLPVDRLEHQERDGHGRMSC
jgi:hypothetical protein